MEFRSFLLSRLHIICQLHSRTCKITRTPEQAHTVRNITHTIRNPVIVVIYSYYYVLNSATPHDGKIYILFSSSLSSVVRDVLIIAAPLSSRETRKYLKAESVSKQKISAQRRGSNVCKGMRVYFARKTRQTR